MSSSAAAATVCTPPPTWSASVEAEPAWVWASAAVPDIERAVVSSSPEALDSVCTIWPMRLSNCRTRPDNSVHASPCRALGGLVAGQALGVDHGFLEHLERRGHAADLVVAADTGTSPAKSCAAKRVMTPVIAVSGRVTRLRISISPPIVSASEAGTSRPNRIRLKRAREAPSFGPRDHVGERGLRDDDNVVGADKLTIAVVDASTPAGSPASSWSQWHCVRR